MSSSKIFNGVSQAIFTCVQKSSEADHGTKYAFNPDGHSGAATTDTVVGTIVVGFDFEAGASSITYTIQKKPFIVSDGQIFDGIGDSINTCKAK